ncbi:hypothetical protein ACN9QM_001614 [Listeria monocytogenes]|nr:hypothetical protein [Listeria monocytogenes]EHY61770.1 hypothetical protein LMIV_2661 [Listeria monocytogenes FSL J1-208]
MSRIDIGEIQAFLYQLRVAHESERKNYPIYQNGFRTFATHI